MTYLTMPEEVVTSFSIPEETVPAPQACWFGDDEQERRHTSNSVVKNALMGWYHAPHGRMRQSGVVLCAPFGHEYMVSYRAYKHLAMQLALAGFPVIHFDYAGTGDSSDILEGNSLQIWQENIRLAITKCKQLSGVNQFSLFGVRLGGLLAASVAAEMDASALVMLAPVISGRAYVRELLAFARMKQIASVAADPDEVVGYPLTAEMQATLSAMDLLALLEKTVLPTLLVARDDIARQEQRMMDKLSADHAGEIALLTRPGYAALMTDDAHSAQVPTLIWCDVVDWLSQRFKRVQTPQQAQAQWTRPQVQQMLCKVSDQMIQEYLVEFSGLVGVISAPLAPNPTLDSEAPIVILSNVGANHRVATHRLYVTMARMLAVQGFMVLRFDRSGFGYSKQNHCAIDNDVYADGGIDDIENAIDFCSAFSMSLTNAGIPEHERRFALAGLCSGAYFAYKTALRDPRVTGLVLLNPLTFDWHTGDSLEIKKRNTYKSSSFYKKALFDLTTWKRLLSNQINIFGIVKTLAVRLIKQFSVVVVRVILHSFYIPALVDQVARNFHEMEQRGVACLMVFDADDGGIDLVNAHLGPNACLLGKSSQLCIEIVDGVDHTFTPIWSHRRISQLVGDFLHKRNEKRNEKRSTCYSSQHHAQ